MYIQTSSCAATRGTLAALSLFLAFLMLESCTPAQAQPQAQAQPTPQLLHNHVRSAVFNGQAPLLGTLPPEQDMHVSIVLPLRNETELASLLNRLYDPSSPDYHHFLSVEEFTRQFGPTPEDYQAVVDYATAHGLAVTETPANRLLVPVKGSVAQINNAFHVTMQVYRHPSESRTFYSPDREPALNLTVPIAHISGLNSFSLPHPAVATAVSQQAIANVLGSGPGGAYLASDMRKAYYGGTALTGTGQAVGILEFGGYNLSDVNLTFSNAGQSYNVPINNVLLDGATAAAGTDDAEQVLDIVQAIGMAPGLSQVRVYIGPATGSIDDAHILNSIASENIAKQISCSWSWNPDDPNTDDPFFREFAAQGQSFFAASGDDGAFDAAISPFFYPAEDAYVTAVGATHLTTNTNGGAWVSESAWNSSGHGTGGGISPDGIALPAWQAGFANGSNGGSATLRNVPDVAMEGDFDNYNCAKGSCNGGSAGTSFAAPRWAGFMALVNQQAVRNGTAPAGGVGFINPILYSLAAGASYTSVLHDPATGNNDTAAQPVWFNAVPGYDLTTGVGSPNGQNLINALAGAQAAGFTLQGSPNTVTITQGGSGSVTLTVTGTGGFQGSVALAVTSGLPAGVTAVFSPNPTTGTSILTLTASPSASVSTAALTITGTSGSLTATAGINLTVRAATITVTDAPSTLTLNQGATGTSTVTVSTQNNSAVTLVASGLPPGVTASFSPNPTTAASVLTLNASTSATPGQYSVTITGTSGSGTASTTLNLAVHATTGAATASITVNGAARAGDVSAITVAFNGFAETVRYDKSSSTQSVASALAVMFSRDHLNAGLCAAANGNVISLKLKQGNFTSVFITDSNVSFQLATAGFP